MSSTDITEDDRTTSLGTIRFAIEYFAAEIASHDVLEKQSPVGATAAPVYSLSGQAIELSLKAFLRQNGASLDDLRRLGHKLVAALDDAEKRGLIHSIDRGQLALLDKQYSAHRFPYSELAMCSC